MPTEIAGGRIHILFLIVSQSIGGAEVHAATVASNLDRRIFRVSLAYLKNEVEVSDFLANGGDEIETFCVNVNHKLDVSAALELSRFARSERVDIIVCVNTYPLIYGWLVKFLMLGRVSIIEILHSSRPFTLKGRLQMRLLRPLFHFSDLLIYVCESQKRYWENCALKARDVSVIYNGVNVAHFRNCFDKKDLNSFREKMGFAEADYVVGLCAYMRPEKAHPDLLRAIRSTRSNGIDVKCLLIGDGPIRKDIESLINILGLNDTVAITGVIKDVRLAICACDVMAIPSHNENFSIAALESMALERPVIMSDVGGASELVHHSSDGFLYPAGDISALSGYIQFLHAPERRRAIGMNALNNVKRDFSEKKMIFSYERIFRQLFLKKKTFYR